MDVVHAHGFAAVRSGSTQLERDRLQVKKWHSAKSLLHSTDMLAAGSSQVAKQACRSPWNASRIRAFWCCYRCYCTVAKTPLVAAL